MLLNLEKEKVTLSIKLYEEIQDKIAIDKFGSKYSGKNLPFSQLSDKSLIYMIPPHGIEHLSH